MTAEKEYLIYLISCFLSGIKPKGREVDWQELYRLADINDICPVLAGEAKLLDESYQPDDKMKQVLKQHIGMAFKAYEEKNIVLNKLKAIMNKLGVDFLLVKGAVIKEIYPVKEFRTSGDFDVIIRENQFEKLMKAFNDKSVVSSLKICDVCVLHYAVSFRIDGVLIELHRGPDLRNDYFGDIFNVAKKINEYEYSLEIYDHLMFVFLHLVKHLNHRGAGIRMLMDIDVIIKSINNFDENCFYSMCEKAGKLKTAQVILAFSNYCFNTPVSDIIDIRNNKSLIKKLTDVLLDGGSFGYETENLGFYHFHKANSDKEVNGITKLKAIVSFLFPQAKYVREYREYSMKHPILIPVAYLARFKEGVIQRRGHSLKTFNQILNVNNDDVKNKLLLEELDFDKKEDA